MIASITGTLEAVAPDRMVVNVGGIGIRVLVPSTVIADLDGIGSRVHLLTHLIVREDALTLYGFSSAEQLRLFELLITVTGVGPALAMGILSVGAPEAVEAAIASENIGFLTRVPKLGPKLAARIALELKQKVRAEPGYAGVTMPPPDADDVMTALLSFGFTTGEASAAIRSLPSDQALSLEEKIRLALAYFSRT